MTKIPHEIKALLSQSRRVLIAAHIAPDGDTVGSALGLAWALEKVGVETRLACADPVPADLRFLPGSDRFAAVSRTDEDVVLAIDAGDLERLGRVYDPEAFAAVPLVNIDHHVTNLSFGSINVVAHRSSTAELILDLIAYLGIPLDATIATCLLTGLVPDTQCFRTSNTTTASLKAAITLMNAGASLAEINERVFGHRPMAMLRLWGPALSRAQNHDGILWTEISQALLRMTGADVSATQGLSNFLSSFDEARVSVVFQETGTGQVDVSLRSVPGVDVSVVAHLFGGGGHPQAAGCLVQGSLAHVREQVLAALRRLLEGQPACALPSISAEERPDHDEQIIAG